MHDVARAKVLDGRVEPGNRASRESRRSREAHGVISMRHGGPRHRVGDLAEQTGYFAQCIVTSLRRPCDPRLSKPCLEHVEHTPVSRGVERGGDHRILRGDALRRRRVTLPLRCPGENVQRIVQPHRGTVALKLPHGVPHRRKTGLDITEA
jgi:hypothetical protein